MNRLKSPSVAEFRARRTALDRALLQTLVGLCDARPADYAGELSRALGARAAEP